MKKVIFLLLFIFSLSIVSNAQTDNKLSVQEAYNQVLYESKKNENDDYITRSEYISVLMKVFGYTNDIYVCSFYDIYETDWYYTYIANAQRKSIALGNDDLAFLPNDHLTVEEAVVFISRTLKIKPEIENYNFSNSVNASEYTINYIEYAFLNELYPLKYGKALNAKELINTKTALELIESFLNHDINKLSDIDFSYGYPQITQSGKTNSVAIKIKTTKPCVVYYKITQANDSGVILTPKKDDIKTHLITVAKENNELKALVPLELNKRYNIFLVLRGDNGETSRVYTIKNVMTLPFTIGNGTKENPYRIYTSYQLNQIRYYKDKHFLLSADIEYNNNWESVGNREEQDEMFSGSFDGGGHTISGLKIKGENGTGFFACLFGGVVKNLSIEADVIGKDYTGVIAGESIGGTVTNCHVTGSVEANGNIAGGIIGRNDGIIKKCVSGVRVVNSVTYSGGVCGTNFSDVIDCISCCQTISADMYASGISGANIDGVIKNCVAACKELNNVITKNNGRITTNKNNAITKNNYAYNNMISDININIDKNSDDGAEVNWSELTNNKFYTEKLSWNFHTDWTFDNRPEFMLPCIKNVSIPKMVAGDTVYSPISIYNETQLQDINLNLDKHYILRNDITLKVTDNKKSNWIPIGMTINDSDTEGGFCGSIDGNGFFIKGIYLLNDDNITQYGFIGNLSGGVLRNIKLSDVYIEGHNKSGAVAAINYGIIENSFVSGKINSNSNESTSGGICAVSYTYISDCDSYIDINTTDVSVTIGGISGINEGFIENCFYQGEITAGSVNGSSNSIIGGICGANYFGMIYESCADVMINALSYRNYCGGICGLQNSGEIYKCSSKGNIRSISQQVMPSSTYAGGISGIVSDGLIMNSYSQNNISIKANNAYCGGIAGFSERGTVQNTYSINTINQLGGIYLRKNKAIYAGGIVGYNDEGVINNNIAINPYILTNGFYSTICAYSSGGFADNNYYNDKIVSHAEVNENAIKGISVSYDELTNPDFYFTAINDGGIIGWIGDYDGNVWKYQKTSLYKFPILNNVKKQDIFKMP